MTKTILTALTITVILFIAPIASGSFNWSMQTAYADPKQACPEGTTLDPSTKKCGTDPTCSTGTYNPATNQCEEEVTVAATCSTGTLNTVTDLCEGTITSAPTCSIGTLNTVTDLCVAVIITAPICSMGGTLNTVTDLCEITICFPGLPPGFPCSTFSVGPPICSIGSYNPVTNLCQGTITSAPTCSIGTYSKVTDKCEGVVTSSPSCPIGKYSTVTNVCEATLVSVATCSIGSLNTETDLCEISPDHGKIPLCHVAGKNGKTVEISVNIESLEGHLIHGDTVGSC